MSINDFVEMTIFLCLIWFFSIYAKMQGFVDECVFFLDSADTEITLSRIISKMYVLLRFTQKLKMTTKNGGKTIFGKLASEMPVPHSLGNIFNTMRYRSTVSVQSSGYVQSTASYIKVQTMFK